jgi:rRNA maturation endonuclease Nob1
MGRPTYYDDNYGHYDIESDDDVEFYHKMQARSIQKKCSGCGRMVKIKKEYAYCNRCADKIERGEDVG